MEGGGGARQETHTAIKAIFGGLNMFWNQPHMGRSGSNWTPGAAEETQVQQLLLSTEDSDCLLVVMVM